MTRYYSLSAALHVGALFAVVFLLAPPQIRVQPQVFRIDFLGGPGSIAVPGPAAAPQPETAKAKPLPAQKKKAPAKAPAVAHVDEFATKAPAKKHIELGRPSILSEPEAAPAPKPAPAPAPPGGQGEGGEGEGMKTDFANFPYPWYITRVRTALWSQWTRQNPGGEGLLCIVRFLIDRDGQGQDIALEQSSGNSLFDYAALSAVQAAQPFPPLPAEFAERVLRVHVQFRPHA